MNLEIVGVSSLCYFYYILGSLTSRTNLWSREIMELNSSRAGSLCYFYYILGSLPIPHESMELGRHGVRSVCYFLHHGQLTLLGEINGARRTWIYTVMVLESHEARYVCYFYYILRSRPSRMNLTG